MKLPEDQQVLQGLLRETITLLCKNGLQYNRELSVEALIVVTMDEEKMFHTNIQQVVGRDEGSDVVEPAFGMSSHHDALHDGASLKRRRVDSSDGGEVPSKRAVRQSKGEGQSSSEETASQVEGVDYVIEERYEEEEVMEGEDSGNAGGGVESVHEFSRDLRSASQRGMQYTEEGATAVLRTTDQQQVQVVQHIGMRLPTELESEAASSVTDTEAPEPVMTHSGRLVKPRGGATYSQDGDNGESDHQEIVSQQELQSQQQQVTVVDPEAFENEERMRIAEELQEKATVGHSVTSTKVMGEPEKLRKIIHSAVDKVRKEVTTTAAVTSVVASPPVICQGTTVKLEPTTSTSSPKLQTPPPQPLPQKQIKAETPGQRVHKRGRPSNLPVTTTPKGREVAIHKPLVTKGSYEDDVLHVLGQPSRPIKVSYGLQNRRNPNQPKICNRCGQTFASVQSLSDHQCGEKNLFQCGICSALFIRKDNLKKHFEEHREEVEVAVLQNQ